MSLSPANKVATLRGLTRHFDAGLQEAMPMLLYPELCTVVPSMGADERYGFMGAMPGMREWVGDRVFNDLRGGDFTLANKEFESSLAIEKNHIDDDRLGMYGPVLNNLGREAMHHPDELLFDLQEAGETTVTWDGQFHYDTDHLWGDSGTQSNDLTYNASDPDNVTEDEFRAAYHAARLAMLGFKNDQGKLFIRPTFRPLPNLLLMVPPALEEVAHKAIRKQLVAAGETNIVLDAPRIIVGASLSSGRKFTLKNLSQNLRPFVFQARRPLARQMKGLDDREFKAVKFMADARYNVGYLAWWNDVLTTFT